MTSPGQRTVSALLSRQAALCHRLEAPTYAALLRHAAADVEVSGKTWEVLEGREDDPPESSVPLRLMAAIHRAVLEGQAPELAARFPTAGGETGDPRGPFDELLRGRTEELRRAIMRPCQTNEVGRSCGLLAGLLEISRRTGLPVRLFEIGSSAGLNLRFDRYRFEGAGAAWGDPSSPVVLSGAFAAPWPPLGGSLRVLERAGCDVQPLDPSSPEDRLTLLSSVWCDHVERFEMLRAALDLAEGVPVRVDRADAASWLEGRVRTPAPGTATVVFHSVMWQYMTPAGRDRVRSLLEAAGDEATAAAPLFWLRQEPTGPEAPGGQEVRLTAWPGGREDLLAMVPPHGRPFRWVMATS